MPDGATCCSYCSLSTENPYESTKRTSKRHRRGTLQLKPAIAKYQGTLIETRPSTKKQFSVRRAA